MDNIEREFSYKVSCVETICDRTFNLCQVIDVRMIHKMKKIDVRCCSCVVTCWNHSATQLSFASKGSFSGWLVG